MLRINLLVHIHSAGLRRDLRVFQEALKGLPVRLTVTAFDPAWLPRLGRGIRRATGTVLPGKLYDINLFVEEIAPAWMPLARVNCLVPHQEWFTDLTRTHLQRMDWVLCKSQFAVQMFESIGSRTAYTGFTTLDRYDPSVRKDFSESVHVGGSSRQKGSATVNTVWLQHPQWPMLTIHWYEPAAHPVEASNIRCVRSFVDERTLSNTQNRCGIHLCPSEAEGFGHYLVEAMSCAAVVLTTAAPPMNELVQPERGVLVGYHRQAPQGVGMNYYVDPVLLGEAVEGVLGTSLLERERMGKRAREWFLENDRLFRTRLWEVLQGIA